MKQEEIVNLLLSDTVKAEGVILLKKWMKTPTQQLAEKILEIAEESIKTTIPCEWNCREVNLPLAPDELEAILFLSIAKRINGKIKESWKLVCYVWSYPGIHNWDEYMRELIYPASAAAALWNVSSWKKQNEIEIWQMSETALECLRQNGSARYGLLLLRMMCNYPETYIPDEKKQELTEFLDFFEQLNIQYSQSQYRLWQNIDMTNAYPMSLFLRRIRMANRKNIKQAAENSRDFTAVVWYGSGRIENSKGILSGSAYD